MLGTLAYVAFVAPVEASMGVVQKIFYFHVPAAYSMYVGALVCFAGSAWFLARGGDGPDAVARAGAEIAVAMGVVVLVTGPLWAAKAWGVYWNWDPRLTTTLLSVLVYIAYGLLRTFGGGGEPERKFAASLGILGAVNLPVIHYSVQKWGGTHPRVVGQGGLKDPRMQLALLLGFVTFTILTALLVWARARTLALEARLEASEREAREAGLLEGA